jgi:hypothetical protein
MFGKLAETGTDVYVKLVAQRERDSLHELAAEGLHVVTVLHEVVFPESGFFAVVMPKLQTFHALQHRSHEDALTIQCMTALQQVRVAMLGAFVQSSSPCVDLMVWSADSACMEAAKTRALRYQAKQCRL